MEKADVTTWYDVHPSIRRDDDGHPLLVLRPGDPDKAVDLALTVAAECATGQISRSEAKKRFDAVPQEQRYTFVGFLSKADRVVDAQGKKIGRLKRGDSIVSGPPESFCKDDEKE